MLLVFTIILLSVSVGILVSLYSIFFPFIQNIGNISNYNSAYYLALSSVERWELVLKYKGPWFSWSGWFLWSSSRGPTSDLYSSIISWANNWTWREISSRTNILPSTWMWNVDYMLSTGDSKNFNMIDYNYKEKIILSMDNTNDPSLYYTWKGNISYFSWDNINWIFRLPPKAFEMFWWTTNWPLCNSPVQDCDQNWDDIYDDIVLNRWLNGFYNWKQFKILPTTSVFYYSWMMVDYYNDNAIRKSVINEIWNIEFTNSFNPIKWRTSWITRHNVISQEATSLNDYNFENIFKSPYISWLELNFSLVSLLQTLNWNIYPFLEYRFWFPQMVSDKFFYIRWNWRIQDYDVQILIKKPASQDNVAWDFTVIF